MPFTPLHMGPGLVLKAVGGRHFSVLVFGLAQVAMDIEPLLGILRGRDVLHGWTHTFAGATAIAGAVAVIAPPPSRAILRGWNRALREHRLAWLESPPDIGWTAILAGAFLGTWSHVLLDGIMHSDLHPFAPWSQAQPWWRLVSIESLHLACIATGTIGVLVWFARAWWRRRTARNE